MPLLYLDPWKNRKFARLKGDKACEYARIAFSEAKFYKHENSYVLAGQFDSFLGVAHAFNPTQALNPSLCEIPIYSEAYESREKKAGTGTNGVKAEYETITIQPSIAEKLLYQHIEDNPTKYLQDGKALKGAITLHPDSDYEGKIGLAKLNFLLSQFSTEVIDSSGKYPDWEVPKSYSKGSYNNFSKGISLEDKQAFLRKELASTIAEDGYGADSSLPIAAYVHKIIQDNQDNERFLALYFDLIGNLVN